jgi:1-deoxy-D-xylulose-5-phosphate synthase
LKAVEDLVSHGLNATVIDARFAKPLDHDLLRKSAQNHDVMITIEEGSSGGFGSAVMQFLSEEGLLDTGRLKLRAMTLPDTFQDHDSPERMYEAAGLDAKGIVRKVLDTLGRDANLRGKIA